MANYVCPYKTLRVKISKLMYSRLKSCSRKRGGTMSEIVREALTKYLYEYDLKHKEI